MGSSDSKEAEVSVTRRVGLQKKLNVDLDRIEKDKEAERSQLGTCESQEDRASREQHEKELAEARASAAAAEKKAAEAEAKARQERQAAEEKARQERQAEEKKRVALEAAHAQEIAELMNDPQAGKMPTRMQKIWKRYDKDGNGMLDANEVKPLMLDVLGTLIIMQQDDKIKAQNKGVKDDIITCNVMIRSLEQEKASMRHQSAEQVAQDLMVGQNDILGNKHGLDKNNDHKISHDEFCSGFKQWFDNKKSMGEMNNLDAIMNAQLQEAMKNMFG